jgi:branched-subunit amino acid transport protein
VAETNIWIALVLAALATYLWRAVGVMASGRLRVDGPAFAWVTYVAYGLLAALVARMIVLPVGESLQEVPLWARVGCAALGAGAYFLSRKNIAAGVAAGAGALAAYSWLASP